MKQAQSSHARLLNVLLGGACLMLSAMGIEAQQSRAEPQSKGIWEPINYPEDVRLHSVYFVNDKTGWIGGSAAGSKGGILLYTSDGGERWGEFG